MLSQTLPLLIALISAAVDSSSRYTTASATPTAEAIVEELNLARSNPSGYADLIEARLKYYEGNVYKEPGKNPVRAYEGRKPVEEAIAILRSMQPLHALTLAPDMNHAAQSHADDQGRTGETGHLGSDESDFVERVARYGQMEFPAGEAISYGPATARDIVVALIVDDGVEDRGHRHTLLDPDYRVAGIACALHPRFRVTCVIDLSAGYHKGATVR